MFLLLRPTCKITFSLLKVSQRKYPTIVFVQLQVLKFYQPLYTVK